MYNVTANLDDIDIMSDTSSMMTRTTNSLFSFNSQRTSKSRRKLLRKKGSSRQGGIFELDYLATQIREIVKRVNGFVRFLILKNSTSYYFTLKSGPQRPLSTEPQQFPVGLDGPNPKQIYPRTHD